MLPQFREVHTALPECWNVCGALKECNLVLSSLSFNWLLYSSVVMSGVRRALFYPLKLLSLLPTTWGIEKKVQYALQSSQNRWLLERVTTLSSLNVNPLRFLIANYLKNGTSRDMTACVRWLVTCFSDPHPCSWPMKITFCGWILKIHNNLILSKGS